MKTNKFCSFPGCKRPYCARNLCGAHYWQKYTAKVRLHELGTKIHPRFFPHHCSFQNCLRKCHGGGLCKLHYKYNRLGRTLKPIGPRCKTFPISKENQKEIKERAGLTILKGRSIFLSHGYPNIEVWENGKVRRVRIHRAVMEKKLGRKLDKNEVVHHKDHDKMNCHQSNLELFSSHSEHLKTCRPWKRR